jgi:hypothetical protein
MRREHRRFRWKPRGMRRGLGRSLQWLRTGIRWAVSFFDALDHDGRLNRSRGTSGREREDRFLVISEERDLRFLTSLAGRADAS